ncbi:MAG: DUF2752 domain-containing protein [Paramuribaculum sp.]|nr:DUF2752 domain-containing protein [Paramuribaculum sp.]
MSLTVKYALYAAIAAVLLTAVVLYATFDPATNPFPRCIFLQLTGWKCPGCGSQRALHALLHLDIAKAWRYNAMLVAAIPIVSVMFMSQAAKGKMPRLYNSLNGRVAIWTSFALLTGWWILRNIFDW